MIENILELSLPQEDADMSFKATLFYYYRMMANVVIDAKGADDYRIEMLTKLAIASIPGEEYREEMEKYMNGIIDEKLAEMTSPSTDETNRIRVDACMKAMGCVSDYLDKFEGLTHRLEVNLE